MKVLLSILGLALLSLTTVLQTGAEEIAITRRASEINWDRQSEPEGAIGAQLWAAPPDGDRGTLLRWPAKTSLEDQTLPREAHFLVLTGTLVVIVDQSNYELGPGGFAVVPRNVKHSIGCEASGACMFLMHVGGK